MVAEVDPTVRSSGTEGLGHPDPVHVYGGGADKLGGPNTVSNPKQEHEVDQLPMDNAAQGTSTLHDNPNVQVVERKLPFKDQVKAYHKIHRGTVGFFSGNERTSPDAVHLASRGSRTEGDWEEDPCW